MSNNLKEIRSWLEKVRFTLDPHGRTLQDLGLIESVSAENDTILCVIVVPTPQNDEQKENLRHFQEGVQKNLALLFPDQKCLLILTHHHPKALPKQCQGIDKVKNIIVVSSGKGGVGKSTVALNFALSLSDLGNKVGLLDADIYGPSLPRLMNLYQKPISEDGKTMSPLEKEGLKLMSMGFLVEEGSPLIWRGPMVQGVLHQMLFDVLWGEMDFLVIDTPPGTGDVHLTLAQKVPLSGAVIVSTPQKLALIDACKAIGMFQKMNVPILGIIENMSFFNCSHCGKETSIFSTNGAQEEAKKQKIPFLGSLPLLPEISELSDQGKPIVRQNPSHIASIKFREISMILMSSCA